VVKLLDVLLLGRARFHELSLRGRVMLSQLPANLALLLVVAIIAVAAPGKLTEPAFVAGQALAVLLLMLSGSLPWQRLPYGSFLVVPFLDFVPIGLIQASASDQMPGLTFLALFPIMWVAGSGFRPRLMVPLSGAAALAMVWSPLLLAGSPDPAALAGHLLAPFMLLAVGVGTSVMTLSGMTQQARVEELLAQAERRERLLDAVLETVDVGVVVIDTQGRGTFTNTKQVEVYAAAVPAEEDGQETGMMIYRDGSEDALPPEQWALERALAGERVEHELFRLGRGPGARTVSVTARDFLDADGERAGTVLASSDVTDVVHAVRARDRFLSTLSHEFRTPLANILGYAELIADDPDLSDASRADVHVIARNAQHVTSMVDELLVVAVTGAGTAVRLPLDVAVIVREAAESFDAAGRVRGIEVRVEADGALMVLADRTGLVRVVDNLVSNALKYSGDGTEVRLSAVREGQWAVVTVEDSGIGIAEDDLEHIFTRFGRSDGVLGEDIPGTGLGLSLSKEVVEAHGGTIECTSAVGEGSTFTVRLPLRGDSRSGPSPAEEARLIGEPG
jgi:signal transduction histidine kinase